RHVDRVAAPAAHAHLLRHVDRVHARRQQVAALHADVVVLAVALEHGLVRALLDRRAAVLGHLARPDMAHRDRGHRQSAESLPVKSVISASSTPIITPSPIEAALPLICALVWILPPPSFRANVTLAFAKPWPPASFDFTASTAVCAASSFSVTSTVKTIDIAPIFTLISALTDSSPVFSSTLPPSTQGTSCSRSRMVA